MYDYENGLFSVLENLDVANQFIKEKSFRESVREMSTDINAKRISRNKKKIVLKLLNSEITNLTKTLYKFKIAELEIGKSNDEETIKELKLKFLKASKKQFLDQKDLKETQKLLLISEINTLNFEISNLEISLTEIKNNFDDFREGELIWNHLNQSQIGDVVGKTIGLPGTYIGNKMQSAAITEIIKRKDNINQQLQKRLDNLQDSSNHSKKVVGYLGEYLKNMFF